MDVHGLERTIIRKLVFRGLASSPWTSLPHAGGPPMIRRSCGGAEEIRTPDLLLAKETLYQLSHGPWRGP
jgi:hypothetical protein